MKIKCSYDKNEIQDIISGKAYQTTVVSDTESRLSDIELKISSSDDDDASRKSSDLTIIKNDLTVIDISDSSNDTSSRGTFDLIIPPPIDFQGSCFKKTDEIVTSTTSKVNSLIESTSPTTTELPSLENQLIVDNQFKDVEEESSPSKRWCFEPVTTPVVVTSSVVTPPPILNPSAEIIPNEIVTSPVLEDVSSTSSNTATDTQHVTSASTPVATPLYRIVNRQLSAKDIIIGPNNEVKRRKISRKRSSLVSFFFSFT